MVMTRLEMLKDRLRRYLIAEAKILNGEEYQLDNRRLRRANLSAVRAAIKELEEEIDDLENSETNKRVKRAVFIE